MKKISRIFQRITSFLLSLAIVLTMITGNAFAADTVTVTKIGDRVTATLQGGDKVDLTVEGLAAEQQCLVLMVSGVYTNSSEVQINQSAVRYIDQGAANASGSIHFSVYPDRMEDSTILLSTQDDIRIVATVTVPERPGGVGEKPEQPGDVNGGQDQSGNENKDPNPGYNPYYPSNPSTPSKPSTPSNPTTSTEKKPDGSTVTTTTKPDGTTTVVTKAPDGGSSTVVTDAGGKVSAEVTLPTGTGNGSAAAGLPMDDIQATGINSGTAPTITVTTGNGRPAKVEIPVSNVTSGTVAVLVRPDGTEEIIKTSVPSQNGIIIKVNSGDTVKIVDNSKYFSDALNHWGHDAINFVAARELFNGTSPTHFSPDEFMTRGMLMTVLARFEGVDTSGGTVWYEKGVFWAMSQGLSDGTNPTWNITREQLVTIIYRFANYKGVVTTNWVSLGGYSDANRVSSWAREAISWAVGTGLITGTSPTTLDPQGNATRAQVATVMKRYIEKFSV